MRSPTRLLHPIFGLLALLALPGAAFAQSEPYKVFDTKPVITNGPYLVALSDTSVSIVWMTDTPSHSRVKYGVGAALDQTEEPQVDGLAPVGLRHVVTLRHLTPGTAYRYQALSTRVVKLKAYWPDKGLTTESAPATFTTFDARAPRARLALVTDTHEDTTRIGKLMKLIDWASTDALVHLGDAFDWVDTEDQLFRKWLTPITTALGMGRPLLYARGNHELRGPFARNVADYVPTPEGRFYFARDIGPIHLTVIDTGEDKPDATNVYADLNKTIPYRADELTWFREQARADARMRQAPFRVIAMHQPEWGWLVNGNAEWRAVANTAGVDLVIAGHNHRFSYEPPNATHAYHLLVVGQDQVATLDATATTLSVTVKSTDGAIIKELTIARRASHAPVPRLH